MRNYIVKIYLLIFSNLLLLDYSYSQKKHSHNDYEQKRPFHLAYELGFDSIEADLFLQNGELYVAHEAKNINSQNTFRKLYLEPLLDKIKENNGFAYKNKQKLQLLIDLKFNGKGILKILYEQLKPHKKALKNVRIVISGDMPKPEEFKKYDKVFFFDGRKNLNYTQKQWKRVGLMSVSFLEFSKFWNGKEELETINFNKIKAFVDTNHAKNKEIRLWATPNTKIAFKTLKELGVDYIGTDDLELLNEFIKK